MATTNRYAIREIAIASFFDLTTGNLVAKLDSLKQSGMENTAETVYAQGGRGNAKLVGFSGNKGVKFTLQDALVSNDVLAMLTGETVVTGVTKVQFDEILPVTALEATLTHTPAEIGKLISVSKVNSDGTKGAAYTYVESAPTATQYTITGKEITFGTGAFAAGEEVMVYYYVNTSADAKKITSSVDKFAGSYRLVLDCLVRDADLKRDFAAQIEVPNAKIDDSSWNIAMAPDGEPTVLDIPLEALKPARGKDLWTMTVYDGEDLPN